MGLDQSGRIGRVAIDSQNPYIVFVMAMGHCYGPQKDRGVYRTRDGGDAWGHVLFTDENTGCFEIAMDPNNSRILFAGMWPLIIRKWGEREEARMEAYENRQMVGRHGNISRDMVSLIH
jgi:hypothetical protein